MKQLFTRLVSPTISYVLFNTTMLLFRIAVSAEMILVHGFKKLGVGNAQAEQVPNPLHLPEAFNYWFAVSANIFFPLLVLLGVFTRLATLPTLAATLTGYFILHWNDAAIIKDTPFIYTICFLLILLFGPGKYSVDNYIYKNSFK